MAIGGFECYRCDLVQDRKLAEGGSMVRNGIVGLGADKVRELARAGAEETLKTLRGEIAAIERAFPDLSGSRRRTAGAMRIVTATANETARRTRRMSAAARRAVSERMKRYWAQRRKLESRAK
jgi:hypothetical protein